MRLHRKGREEHAGYAASGENLAEASASHAAGTQRKFRDLETERFRPFARRLPITTERGCRAPFMGIRDRRHKSHRPEMIQSHSPARGAHDLTHKRIMLVAGRRGGGKNAEAR